MPINQQILEQLANPRPLNVPSPLEPLTNGLALKNQMQTSQMNGIQLQNAAQGQADAATTRAEALKVHQLLIDAGGDIEKALPQIAQQAPTLYPHYADYVDKANKSKQDLSSTKSTQAKTDAETADIGRKAALPIETAHPPGSHVTVRMPDGTTKEYDVPEAPKNIDPLSPAGQAATVARDTALSTVPTRPSGGAPRTVTTAQGVMQWNPATNKFDIKAGDRPPTAAQVVMNQKPTGDFTVEGKAFLESIPIQWRKTVDKIAHYDEDPTKVASMRGGSREQIMQWVNQVNPQYDASEFTNRAPTRKAFTTGVQGQQINALNTGIGHLDQLTGLASALKNDSFTPGNEFYNWVKTTFGSDAVTNFDTLKDALAGESASILAKGTATVSGIAAEKAKMASYSSPKQLAGYVKTLIPLWGSKLNSLDYQYHQAMGPDDFSALSPESKAILTKNGFNPADPLKSGAAAGGGADPATAPKIGDMQTHEGAAYKFDGKVWVKQK